MPFYICSRYLLLTVCPVSITSTFSGVLLYGPPGCAKTSLACALASAMNVTFLSVSAADLYSPYVGEAERSIGELFHRARLGAPTILFIDEIGNSKFSRF
jgi:ATP-dependent 26S proteasome regulatory subunit